MYPTSPLPRRWLLVALDLETSNEWRNFKMLGIQTVHLCRCVHSEEDEASRTTISSRILMFDAIDYFRGLQTFSWNANRFRGILINKSKHIDVACFTSLRPGDINRVAFPRNYCSDQLSGRSEAKPRFHFSSITSSKGHSKMAPPKWQHV